MTVNASDGQDPSIAVFAPSAHPSRHVLLPDPHFYRNGGFDAARRASATAQPWEDRSSVIVWRGARNGEGRRSLDLRDADDPSVIPRYRLVMKLRDASDCDVRLSLYRGEPAGMWADAERRAGFLAERIPQETWLGRKYAIDIDGYTNAWSNFLVRLHYGCCVLKVGSQHGYVQWYYDRIRPFEHFVPVRADMSDLLEKIDWVRSHDAEAGKIAANGQAFARTLDFETVRMEAVEIIRANWDRPLHG